MKNPEQIFDVIFEIEENSYSWIEPVVSVRRKDLNIDKLTEIVANTCKVDVTKVELLGVHKRDIPLFNASDLNSVR